jgi:hypothetical protein
MRSERSPAALPNQVDEGFSDDDEHPYHPLDRTSASTDRDVHRRGEG